VLLAQHVHLLLTSDAVLFKSICQLGQL
jgi:hypothetical protein